MNKNRKNDCPSSEDLSAWYDAGQPSGRISVHIATCDKCRHEVESFASIDLELSSFINDGSKPLSPFARLLRSNSKPIRNVRVVNVFICYT